MKLEAQKNIVSSNLAETHDYKVEMNPVMVDILSSKICYSDEITAFIRELSCNAFDSHVAAGVGDVPFKVVLPNEIEPTFVVQDFGVGMSIDDVYNIYTSYGTSTKTDTNEQVGALGLGSKSPFAYQDSFTIVAVKDGSKATFLTSITNGIPAISLVSQTDTDEPNGVTIQVPVNQEDIDKIVRKAAEVFSVFEVQPEISGHNGYEDQSIDQSLFSNGLALVNNGKNTWDVSKVYAIQGNVRYNVDVRKLKDGDWLNSLLKSRSQDVYIKYPIGAIDFTVSREELQYTERTISSLDDTFAQVKDNFRVEIQRLIDEADTYWEACRLWHKECEIDSDLFSSTTAKLSSFGFKTDEFSYKGRTVRKEFTISVRKSDQTQVKVYFVDGQWREVWDGNGKRVNKMTIRLCPFIIHNDMNTRFQVRIQQTLFNEGVTDALVIKADQHRFDAIMRVLGNPRVIKLSEVELDDSPTEKSTYVKKDILLRYV